MAKRPIQKMDLVPEWLRQTIAEDAPLFKTGAHADIESLPDPYVAEGMVGQARAMSLDSLIAAPGAGHSAVTLSWKDGDTLYTKNHETAEDAAMDYTTKLATLKKLEKDANNPGTAGRVSRKEDVKKAIKAELDKWKAMSDPFKAQGTGLRGNSSIHEEIVAGWNVIEKTGQLHVEFSEEFLSTILTKFKKEASIPNHIGEVTYSTSSRQHCGSDNFVVSYWRKATTEDGNIIRNAAVVSRIEGESHVVSGMSMQEFNTLCASLTPDPKHYGIKYDSVTGKCHKTAGALVEFFWNTVEELQAWIDSKKGTASAAPMDLPPLDEEPKKKKKDKDADKDADKDTAAMDALLESAPIPGAGEGPTATESQPLTEGGSAPLEMPA